MSEVLLSLLLLIPTLSQAEGETRGLRNNNPANIVSTRIKWKGEVECGDTRFECFSTPYHGIRAMYRNLSTYYYKHNKRTIMQVMHRWSPKHENKTERIIRIISSKVDRLPSDHIPISDTNFLYELGDAIIKMENSSNPYSKVTVYKAIFNIFGERIERDEFRRQAKRVLSENSRVDNLGLSGGVRDNNGGFLRTRWAQGELLPLQEISRRPESIQGQGVSYQHGGSSPIRIKVGRDGGYMGRSMGRWESLLMGGVLT